MTGTVEHAGVPRGLSSGWRESEAGSSGADQAGVRIEEGANPKMTVNDIIPLEEAKAQLPRSLRIRVPLETATEATVDALHALCARAQRRGQGVV